VNYAKAALWGGVSVVASIVVASIHPDSSAAVMFAATEHLASAFGTAAVAPEIGGAAFAFDLQLICLRWLEKLVRLREARPNIASRGLSRE
jgi:hypothetical protein